MLSDLCTFAITGEKMILQKLYQCATCNMTKNEDCICEICIKNCHEGHITFKISKIEMQGISYSRGFCVCGDEGSIGIRSCKMLTGEFISELYILFPIKSCWDPINLFIKHKRKMQL